MSEELKEWSEELRIYPVVQPDISLEQITSLDTNTLDIDDYEDLMINISKYVVYLNAIKDALAAQIQLLEPEIDYKINDSMSLLTDDFNFKTKEFKKTHILKTFPDLKTKHDKLVQLKTKLARIHSIPFTVRTILDSIRLKYQRLCKDKYVSQY